MGYPHSSVSKDSACSVGDPGSIPGSGRSPGEGNGNPLQYPCLKNSMERGVWQAAVHDVARVGSDLVTKPPPRYFSLVSPQQVQIVVQLLSVILGQNNWPKHKLNAEHEGDKRGVKK